MPLQSAPSHLPVTTAFTVIVRPFLTLLVFTVALRALDDAASMRVWLVLETPSPVQVRVVSSNAGVLDTNVCVHFKVGSSSLRMAPLCQFSLVMQVLVTRC